MASDVRKTDIHEVLSRHDVHYEVHPYYVVLDRRPAGAPPVEQRVMAGFDVDLYGPVETWQLPIHQSEQGRLVLNYFESVARDIQSRAGNACTVEVMPDADTLILDAHQHFQPQAMLRIRISHDRGLDQPEGAAEEEALKEFRETLHDLGVKQA